MARVKDRVRELTLVLTTIALGACATQTNSPERSPAVEVVEVEQTPASEFEALQDRMIGAQRVEFEFEIDSEGALVSHFSGRVRWVRDGEFSVVATGEFVGVPQQLELRGDSTTLTTIVAGTERWTGARPPELIEAVVIGLTHMGLLHNLAVLTGGDPPDHADGGAHEWLGAGELEAGPTQQRGEVEAHSLEFAILVSGQAAGRTTLWLDARGLPIERQSAVEFPDGEMRVFERYSNFVVTP
jgi:hypothetical protein